MPDPTAFVAEVAPLSGPDQVPFDAAVAQGHLIAGRTRTVAALGTAAVLGLPGGLADPHAGGDVSAWLRSVERLGNDGPPGPQVLAVGAVPFDPLAPATLVVPARTWCVDADGRGWRVDVRRRGSGRTPAAGGGTAAPAGGEGLAPRLTEIPPGRGYADAVARALEDIDAGRLLKVVLSRSIELRLPRAPHPPEVLERLWGHDPAFRPYSVPVDGGRMVGASPELLVARHGTDVLSHAFAGTVALADGDEEAVPRLLASAKDRDEHRIVVEAIAEALGPVCSRLEVPDAPSVVRLRSDARLGSLLHGTLRRHESALELLGLLHPTPAVGGVPRTAALERIAQLEPPRGPWAGAVGWVDAAGDGCWVLAIRSALIDGARAVVRAGAGIVSGSDPLAELAETTVKLTPVLEALWPGGSTLL